MGECGRTCFEHWEEPLLGAGRTASNQHSESWLWPRPISQHVSPNRPYKVNKSSMAWRRLGIACSWRMPDVDFSSLIFLNSGSVVRMAASFLNQQWFIAPGLCHCYINIVGILWNWRFNHLQDLQDPASSTSTCVLYITLPSFFLLYPKDLSNPLVSSCQGSIFGASTLLVTAWSAIFVLASWAELSEKNHNGSRWRSIALAKGCQLRRRRDGTNKKMLGKQHGMMFLLPFLVMMNTLLILIMSPSW